MKRKVLIVDDDVNFRYAIRELIPWKAYNFEVAGEAIHGQQALELLEKEKIHVVLTDMEMPIMDGVVLTEQIKNRYPDVIVLALSAYDDFSFVKESMRLGASDYILKQDFDPEKTMELILSYCKEQDEMRTEELHRELENEDLLRYLRNEENCFLDEKKWLPLCNRKDLAVLIVQGEQSNGVFQLDREAGAELMFRMRCASKRWVFIIAILEMSSEKRKHEIYQEIMQAIGKVFSSEVRVGYSGMECDFSGLPKNFSQGMQALDYMLYYPKQRIFCFQDFRQNEKNRQRHYHYLPDETVVDQKELVAHFTKTMQKNMPEKEILHRNFVALLRYFLSKHDMRMEEEQIIAFYDEIEGCLTLQEMERQFEKTAEKLLEKKQNTYQGNHVEIRKALDYIAEHYAEDLSLAELSEYTGLSENYFSNLFKKEMGVTLKTYLNTIRMEKARSLLRETNLKVYEVAERVGYHNATYFMTLFKKMMGESVSDYRNRRNL